MAESDLDLQERLTQASIPALVALDDFYDTFGPEYAEGLIAGLIQHKRERDKQYRNGVPFQ